jgi:uncharacterized membrane protein YphA (DoxX/SURF4 family)
MKIVILIIELVVATLFILAAIMKLVSSYKIRKENPEDGLFAPLRYLRIVSSLEILASLLLVIPTLIGSYRFVTVVAAVTLIVIMIGAPISHLKMGEQKEASITAILLFLLVYITFFQFFAK